MKTFDHYCDMDICRDSDHAETVTFTGFEITQIEYMDSFDCQIQRDAASCRLDKLIREAKNGLKRLFRL